MKAFRVALASWGAAACTLLVMAPFLALEHQGSAAVRTVRVEGGLRQHRHLLFTPKHELEQEQYRWLHSDVPAEPLQCHGELTADTQRLIEEQQKQWQLQWQPLEEGLVGGRPPFMANATSRNKQCRPAPRGQELPKLHRLALLGPAAQALASAPQAAVPEQHRSLQQAQAASAGRAHKAAAGVDLGGPGGGSLHALQAGAAEQLREWLGLEASGGPDVTLVTQLSLDSLPLLERQCRRWRGPIAAVVYVPLVVGEVVVLDDSSGEAARLSGSSPREVLEYVTAYHQRMDHAPGGCLLTLEVVVEERCSSHLAALYPINANRNRAMMLARTRAVALVDVDFLAGGSLSPWLHLAAGAAAGATPTSTISPAWQQAAADGHGEQQLDEEWDGRSGSTGLAGSQSHSKDDVWLANMLAAAGQEGRNWLEAVLSENAAVVLPALEVSSATPGVDTETGLTAVLRAADASKAGVVAMMESGEVSGFQLAAYPQGQNATRYSWWMQTQEPYAVDYWQGYEPFLLMPTALVSLTDERFRGNGWEKHMHTLHAVQQLDMKLVVHPSAWVVHMPHKRSMAQTVSKATVERTARHNLFLDAQRSILARTYLPATAFHKLCATHVETLRELRALAPAQASDSHVEPSAAMPSADKQGDVAGAGEEVVARAGAAGMEAIDVGQRAQVEAAEGAAVQAAIAEVGGEASEVAQAQAVSTATESVAAVAAASAATAAAAAGMGDAGQEQTAKSAAGSDESAKQQPSTQLEAAGLVPKPASAAEQHHEANAVSAASAAKQQQPASHAAISAVAATDQKLEEQSAPSAGSSATATAATQQGQGEGQQQAHGAAASEGATAQVQLQQQQQGGEAQVAPAAAEATERLRAAAAAGVAAAKRKAPLPAHPGKKARTISDNFNQWSEVQRLAIAERQAAEFMAAERRREKLATSVSSDPYPPINVFLMSE